MTICSSVNRTFFISSSLRQRKPLSQVTNGPKNPGRSTSLHRGVVHENVLDCDTGHINCGVEPRADTVLRDVRPTSGEHLVQEPKNGTGIGICRVVVGAEEVIDI